MGFFKKLLAGRCFTKVCVLEFRFGLSASTSKVFYKMRVLEFRFGQLLCYFGVGLGVLWARCEPGMGPSWLRLRSGSLLLATSRRLWRGQKTHEIDATHD